MKLYESVKFIIWCSVNACFIRPQPSVVKLYLGRQGLRAYIIHLYRVDINRKVQPFRVQIQS